MKKANRILSMLLGFAIIMGISSCKKDEIVITPDEGIPVADGFYITVSGVDPTSVGLLVAEEVSIPDFKKEFRDGLVGGYLFLAAGDYTVVEIVSKEIKQTIGGSAETITDALSGCSLNDYTLITAAVDGAAFSIANAGVYKVTYDALTSEIVLAEIVNFGLIGSATDGGWGADQTLLLQGSSSETSTVFEGADIVLRAGEYKIRFNCRWNMDRRIDSGAPSSSTNGYELFTNFGGTLSVLDPGGSNLVLDAADEGTYTVTITFDANGIGLALTRTGDVPPVTFDPATYAFGVIGDATANGWDADRDLYYKGIVDGSHTWLGVVTFAGTGEFKFRTNDDWAFSLGGTLAADGSESTLVVDGGNIPTPGAGGYYIIVKTADEGTTWIASMTTALWGVIGTGSPQGNWDADIDMTSDGFSAGVSTYSITGDFIVDGWKFRAGDAWDYNLGGDLAGLSADGDNITLDPAGNYTVVLSFDGSTYSAVATKN